MDDTSVPQTVAKNEVRPPWLQRVVRELQLLASASALSDPVASERRSLFQRFLLSTPRPRSAAEELVLSLMAREAARRLGVDSLLQSGPACRDAVGAQHPDRLLIWSVRAFVDTHYAERLTCGALANRFGITTRALNSMCRNALGRSMKAYLRKVRVSRAIAILRQTPVKIEAVSMMVGYQSKKDFYRAFRAETNCRPTHFRQCPAGRSE